MNYRKITLILIFLFLLIIPLAYASDGGYKIPQANKHITINDDGACLINEEITYDISGSVNGVFRDIPLEGDQNISNIKVTTPGYYNTLEVIEYRDKLRLKVWLYEDKEKTRKVSDEKVDVIFEYTFNKGVKVYNDIAEFQYMSWGNDWASPVGSLKTIIKIPGSSSQTEYWNNPDTYVKSSSWNENDELVTMAEDIPNHSGFEQRILMPKSYFKSTKNANVIHMDAKAQIESDQQKYAVESFFKYTLAGILPYILGILMIIPVGIYAFLGREPKIDYNAEYEYDLPTDSKPVEVNCIAVGDVGQINEFAFNAVILDLIDKGFFRIITANAQDTVIRYTNKAIDGLLDYEVDVINYLNGFRDSNGNISLASISANETQTHYWKFMNNWYKKARASVPNSVIIRYFDYRGAKLIRIFSIILFLLFIVMIILSIALFRVNVAILAFMSFIMMFEAIYLFFEPNTKGGRWTREGKEYHDKWYNFKNYISDYSLINEKPPESVQVWGRYLVYAAALGYATAATNTMQRYFNTVDVSDSSITDSDVVQFTYHGGFDRLNTSFQSFHTSSNSSSSYSSVGSAGGGGFGGGGGGTF